MTPSIFTQLINAIKNRVAVAGNTKTIIGDAIAESSKQANTYVAEETVIGEWFGKPLYRRVISFTLDGNGQASVATSTFNIDQYIRCDMMVLANAGKWGLESVTVSGGSISVFSKFISDAGNSIAVSARGQIIDDGTEIAMYTNAPVNMIIEYTKTTDNTGGGI